MEKYVDERALRHFRDKAVEVDIQPKIDKLQSDLNSAKTSLTNRIDNYVEQLCRVETGGALLQTAARIPVRLPFAGLYSARLVVWLNGTTSSVSGSPVFSISASGTNAVDDFVKVSLGSGNYDSGRSSRYHGSVHGDHDSSRCSGYSGIYRSGSGHIGSRGSTVRADSQIL